MKKIIGYCAAVMAVALSLYPATAITAAGDALAFCAATLIPSLFPFFVCANALISGGVISSAGRLFEKIARRLFRVGGEGAATILLGLVSGYPAGAAVTCRLYTDGSISRTEAHRLLAFTNNAGPLFIIGAIGTAVYQSPSAGYLLCTAQALAALSTGICMRYWGTDSSPCRITPRRVQADPMGDAVTTVLSLCGFVIFFSVVTAFLHKTGFISFLCGCLTAMGVGEKTAALLVTGSLEISAAARSGGGALPAMAGLLSFGGISVLLQTASLVRKAGLSIKSYLAGKLLSAGLSAAYCRLLLSAFPHTVPVSLAPSAVKAITYGGYLAAAVLLAAGVYLLYILLHFLNKRLRPADFCATIKNK